MAMVCLTYAAVQNVFERTVASAEVTAAPDVVLCFPVVDPGSQLKPGISLLAFDAQLLNMPRCRSSLTSPRICPREQMTLHNRRFHAQKSTQVPELPFLLRAWSQSPEHGNQIMQRGTVEGYRRAAFLNGAGYRCYSKSLLFGRAIPAVVIVHDLSPILSQVVLRGIFQRTMLRFPPPLIIIQAS